MTVTFTPSHLSGVIQAPPSKSMGHRMLICAGLANGQSNVKGISHSEDMLATMTLLNGLGASCARRERDDIVDVKGIDPLKAAPCEPLNCRECGSTLRFFIPICLLSDKSVTLTGSFRLFERPLSVYADLCSDLGLTFDLDKTTPKLTLKGPLRGGCFTLRGDVSSQFITGLLFALPLCAEDSILTILPPLESRPYLDLTLSALALYGIEAEWQDALTLRIPGRQTYKATAAVVEGDYSNAAFFHALAVLGHHVTVMGLNPDSLQGDRVYRDFYPQLATGRPTVDISDCPDLGPILMAVASAMQGATFTGTRRLRIKESDRAAAMAEELAKFGVSVIVEEDTVTVNPVDFHAPAEFLDGHNDHRIVMALSTLLTLTGGTLRGAEAVNKSLPDYFDLLGSLGADIAVTEV
ncbi:MAG: 3-phosphoshikimate 1-carboxyvinyltransferase [Ruminococcaceae bacterium]|nr:3-phosphoshikimate 1-carboxyvinyltransferase [Oscillospiraceae bacterium]